MKRVLVIAPGPAYEQEPSFRLRILALREAMARRGYAWEVHVRPKTPWGRLALAWRARGYDAVILHRRMLDGYEARALRRRVRPPRRILMDIDDATMYHETKLGAVARRRLDRRFEATTAILDGVCAGNPYLAEIYAQKGKPATVVPTVVEPSRYQVKQHLGHAGQPVRLVWIGSGSTLKYLEGAMPALGEAATQLAKQGAAELRLVVICDRPPGSATVPVEFVPWSLEGEAEALARGDIGIAPTPEDRWTLGKSGFKIVQYMATGLPVVASPVGVNVELVNGGAGGEACGFLPKRWEEWPGMIGQLAVDVGLRQKMGAAGRRRVEAELCVETMADRWAAALG
jgi:glycosyltransferase involved in cell wall biosynthesis